MSTETTGTLSLGPAEIDYQAENMVLFSALIPAEATSPGEYNSIYVARLVGADPVYGIRRVFQPAVVTRAEDYAIYEYLLSDGLYEVTYRKNRSKDRTIIDSNRLLVFYLDGREYVYPYDEVDKEYLLLSIFNYYLTQFDDPVWIMRKFFSNNIEKSAPFKPESSVTHRISNSICE